MNRKEMLDWGWKYAPVEMLCVTVFAVVTAGAQFAAQRVRASVIHARIAYLKLKYRIVTGRKWVPA